MRRRVGAAAWITALTTALTTASVAAEPHRDAPPGWTHHDEDSLRRTALVQGDRHLESDQARVRIDAWTAPGRRGTLWITRISAPVAAADRDRIASAQLAELAVAAKRNEAQIDASAQRWVEDARQLEATIRWRNHTLGVRQLARTLVVADGTQLHAVTGECVIRLDADVELERACGAALDQLVLGSDLLGPRVTLAIVDPGASPVPSAVDPTPEPPIASPTPHAQTDAPRLDPGPPGRIAALEPRAPTRDRRPMYLGIGILVLAAVFWWNRRRRERFEREPASDRDADDLHAAARDDAPKDDP